MRLSFTVLTLTVSLATVSAFAPTWNRAPRATRGELRMAETEKSSEPDFTTIAGIEGAPTSVPEGTKFEVPIKAAIMGQYDGEKTFSVMAKGIEERMRLNVVPDAVGFETFYAGFAEGAPSWLSVEPVAGQLDRKGGKDTIFTITADPQGEEFDGDVTLVLVLPDDIDKAFKISLKSGDFVPPS